MLAAGTTLGPYTILTPLGSGGMGEVYRARDTRLGRDVAVKVILAESARDPERVKRFEQEARAAGALNHPNVCAIHDLGTHDGSPYVVMELLEGESLRQKLDAGPIPARKAIDYAAQVAHGLAAAHEKGIVHRDLKPENLFLAKDGRVKVLDFGLAKLTRPEVLAPAGERPISIVATETGAILGTVGYMSPEQVRGQNADAHSDLFALGAILYELLTGKRAFHGASHVETLNAILNEEPAPLSASGRELPPGLEPIVRHCLEKSPDERFQSASDLAFSLESVSGSAAGAAAAPARVAEGRRRRTGWLLPFAVLGCTALVAVIVVVAWMRSEGSRAVTFSPKTFQPSAIFNARFTPDGQSIIFSAAPEGNTPELFSIRPEYIAPRPLGLRQTHLLAVSSSGELAVLTDAMHIAHCVFKGTLARLPLGAEAPRELLENVRDADWNPEGSALAIIREVGGRDRLEYPIGKVLCESGGYLSDVRFSPRGDRIAFFDHPSRWDDRGSIKVTDLSGRVTELSIGYAAEEGIVWSPDGGQIYFTGADSSITSSFGGWVFAVTLSGKRRLAQQSSGALIIHDISRRGRWLVTRDDLRLGISARPPRASDERDLSWLDGSGELSLSADGRTMLFTETGGQHNVNYQVCLRGTDGSPVVRLGEGDAQQVSPDGRWALAFVPTSPARPMLYPTGAGEPVKLDRGNIVAYESGGAWFPDGRRVVLCGIEPGRSSRVYVQEVPTGAPRAITPEGTHLGALSPDGRLVLASGSDGSWAIYPVEGGTPRPVPGITAKEGIARWSKDGLSVFVFDPRQIPCRVDRLSLATGRRDSVMLLGTGNRTGLVRVIKVSMADDPHIYAYSHSHMLSTLFVVDGAR